MNVFEALRVALPDIPPEVARPKRLPRVNPEIIAREQLQEGRPVVLLLIPEVHTYYVFEPEHWTLLQLFDGERGYAEIADLYAAETGVAYTEDAIRDFVEQSRDALFWYRSAQERNAAYWEQQKQERRNRLKKAKHADLAEISFSAWDPDKFLTWLHDKLRWVFTPWFVGLNLALFAFMLYIFIENWGQISYDTIQLYNFSNKGFADILQIWVLFFAIGFIHETAHGITCKHTGAGAHRMGFLLIYLSPAFFCDTTETWVYGGKWQRIATCAAGIWVTLLLCSVASIVWWGTPPGTGAHDFAYLLMLTSGLLPVAINLNPLIKLDGYFILTEFLEIGDLKENSTAFVTAWVKRNLFGLPVEVPYVPFRRQLLYVPYTLLSSLYSYTLLFIVVSFAYNIAHSYTPEWAFLPAGYLAWLVFKSRILALGRFMKQLYLDKKDRVAAWLTPQRRIALAAAAVVLLFIPAWRETVEGPFVLEPALRTVLRAEVPGRVVEVNADESDRVAAGEVVVRLRNLGLESEAARAGADYRTASARLFEAQLRNADYGVQQREAAQLQTRNTVLSAQVDALAVRTPIAGTVLTPRLRQSIGAYVEAGDEIAQIGDLSSFRARVYLPEALIRKVRPGARVAVQPQGFVGSVSGEVVAIAPAPAAMPTGVPQATSGLQAPAYYPVTVLIAEAAGLRDGQTGAAKILVQRRSLAGFAASEVLDFLGRKVW